jgi:hypothetical protein
MIELTLPEWMGWLIGAAVALHAAKSLLEITTHSIAKKMLEDGLVEEYVQEMQRLKKERDDDNR